MPAGSPILLPLFAGGDPGLRFLREFDEILVVAAIDSAGGHGGAHGAARFADMAAVVEPAFRRECQDVGEV
jgi:hypothetical protein